MRPEGPITGVGFSGRGQPHQRVWENAVRKLPQRGPGRAPAAKGFSRILNTQDDLSGQKDYGPRFYFFASWPSGRA